MRFRRFRQNMEVFGREAGRLWSNRYPYAGVASRVPGSRDQVSDGDGFRAVTIIPRLANSYVRGAPAYQIV